jgi:hypothetical protein
VSPVRYKLGLYIPEDDILHSHCHENLKSYIAFLQIVAGFNLPNLNTNKKQEVKYL